MPSGQYIHKKIPVMDRLARMRVINPVTGCWNFTGYLNEDGYGIVQDGEGRARAAHIVAYENTKGPIPPDKELDHTCRNRACWNPDHVEPVTHAENVRRSDEIGRIPREKTQCPQGHPYPPGERGKKRNCKECGRTRAREFRRKKFAIDPSKFRV